MIPRSNITGLPEVTVTDLKSNDPSRLNRIIRLLATQLQAVQQGVPTSAGITNNTTTVTPITPATPGSGGGGGGTSSSTVTIQGTHVQKLSIYLAPNEPLGCYFYETDRGVFYLNYLSDGNVKVWIWSSGTMYAASSSRPTDLGVLDTGFLFYATDLLLVYRWSGTAWVELPTVEPVLQDTHANRLTKYPSVDYAPNTLFFETDRTSIYIVQNTSGTVTVTGGTNVAWVSGDHFVNGTAGFNAAQLPAGTAIVINGVSATIAAASSSTALTLQTAVANGVGVSYSIPSGKWVFATGEYIAAYASKPTDIADNDVNFVFQDNATYYRSWTWSGAAWSYTIGQPPYLAVQLTMVNFTDVGWHLADGTTITVSKSDATTTSITLPNSAGYWVESGPYTGTQIAAVKSTINAITPSGTVSQPTFSGTASGSTNVLNTGGATAVVPAPFTPAGTVSQPTFAGNSVTPTINVEGAPPTMVFPMYVKL